MTILDRILKGTQLLLNEPKLFLRVIRAKFFSPLKRAPRGSVLKALGSVAFEFDFSYGPQMKTMYFDAFEPLTIHVMKRYLREGDTFFDVGANVGYLSAVGANLVGPKGQVHCFEPAPRDFKRLERFSYLNPQYPIVCNPCAVGEEPGMANLDVTSLWWMGWNTLVPNFMRRNAWKEGIAVPVIRLDDYIEKRKDKLGAISLIKVDTEGFELPVLKGLQGYFEADSHRPAIICEITPRAYPLLGRSLIELAESMKQYGYRAYRLWNLKREIDVSQLTQQTDVLFVRGRPQ